MCEAPSPISHIAKVDCRLWSPNNQQCFMSDMVTSTDDSVVLNRDHCSRWKIARQMAHVTHLPWTCCVLTNSSSSRSILQFDDSTGDCPVSDPVGDDSFEAHGTYIIRRVSQGTGYYESAPDHCCADRLDSTFQSDDVCCFFGCTMSPII